MLIGACNPTLCAIHVFRYVALFPTNEMAKLIIQSGIKEIIYMSDKLHDQVPFVAARKLLDMAGVSYK